MLICLLNVRICFVVGFCGKVFYKLVEMVCWIVGVKKCKWLLFFCIKIFRLLLCICFKFICICVVFFYIKVILCDIFFVFFWILICWF